MSERPGITWARKGPGVWRSTDGRYAVVATILPEDRPEPTTTYTLRKIDSESAAAYPGTLGSFLTERYNLEEAQDAAIPDAHCDAHRAEMSIPEDFPAVTLERFWWPISQGVTKGALAIVRDGDRIVARVIGMACREGPFEPVTYAEVDLP